MIEKRDGGTQMYRYIFSTPHILLAGTLIAPLIGCSSQEEFQYLTTIEDPIPLDEEPGRRLDIVSWKVGSDKDTARQVAQEVSGLTQHDVVLLSGVAPGTEQIMVAAIPDFGSVVSPETGGTRAVVLFRQSRMELKDAGTIGDSSAGSAEPFYVRIRDVASRKEMYLVVASFSDHQDVRDNQFQDLQTWASNKTVGIIASSNLDLNHSKRSNGSMFSLRSDKHWQWVKPFEALDTHWFDPDGDGHDNSPNVMEDLVFVAGPAKNWMPASGIVVFESEFRTAGLTSRHRPVELSLIL